MRKSTILDIAFLLLFAALPLISIGGTGGPEILWQVGFGLLVLGLLIPPALRLRKTLANPEDEPDIGEEPS